MPHPRVTVTPPETDPIDTPTLTTFVVRVSLADRDRDALVAAHARDAVEVAASQLLYSVASQLAGIDHRIRVDVSW